MEMRIEEFVNSAEGGLPLLQEASNVTGKEGVNRFGNQPERQRIAGIPGNECFCRLILVGQSFFSEDRLSFGLPYAR